MPSLVKLRSRAQVTLPKEAVKKLNLKEGDNLSIEVYEGKVLLPRLPLSPKMNYGPGLLKYAVP